MKQLARKEASNNQTQYLEDKRKKILSHHHFHRNIFSKIQTLPKFIQKKQIPDYPIKKRQKTYNSEENIKTDNMLIEKPFNPQTFKVQIHKTKYQYDEEPKLRRLLQTFSEVIETETLRQYLIYLQDCYKMRVVEQTQQNSLNKYQKKFQIVSTNFQLLQMIQISIKNHIKTIIKQRQEFENIKNIMQRDIIPKMQFQTQVYSGKSYSQILRGYLNKQLNNNRQMDIKNLRLRKKTIKEVQKIKQKILVNQFSQKNQTMQSLKRQNQFLEEKKRQMSQLIQILKAKNQQLTNQIHKYKGENSFLSSKNHPLDKKYKRSMDQDQKSQKILFSERSISPVLQKLYFTKSFKTTTKQLNIQINQQQETNQKKVNQLIIINKKMNQKFQKKLEDKNNLINSLKNIIREKDQKIIQILNSKAIIEQKRILSEQNSFAKSNTSMFDVYALEKIKKFKVQVGQLLIKSEAKIKQQQRQLKEIYQIIQLSEKEITKIMDLIKIERQLSNQNSQNSVIINLKNIYDQLSIKIAKQLHQQKMKQRQEKIKYRNQLIEVIEQLKSRSSNNLTMIEQIPDQQQNQMLFKHIKRVVQ